MADGITKYNAGTNIFVEVDGEKKTLVIRVDLTHEIGPSGSGKSISVATTGGNQPLIGVGGEAQFYLGMNVYKRA